MPREQRSGVPSGARASDSKEWRASAQIKVLQAAFDASTARVRRFAEAADFPRYTAEVTLNGTEALQGKRSRMSTMMRRRKRVRVKG